MVRLSPDLSALPYIMNRSYDLPYRIHSAKVYPLRSPNGSTIILCGHEQGLLILWRGGRPFKPPPPEPGSSMINPPSKFEVMAIDSDEEEPVQSQQTYPCFEEEQAEYDPSEPFRPIIQSLELFIGLEVLHISFPNFSPEIDHSATISFPSLLSDNIVLALGCADTKIRVLTLPLMPPSPQTQKTPKFQGEGTLKTTTIETFGGQIIDLSGHSSVPRGVCITITAHNRHPNADDSSPDSYTSKNHEKSSHHQSHVAAKVPKVPKVQAQKSAVGSRNDWELLVASLSTDFSDVLLIHRMPLLESGSKIDSRSEHLSPHHTHQLTSLATCICFNTSLYPAPQHSEILIAEAKGILRVLNCLTSHQYVLENLWPVSLYTAVRISSDSLYRRKSIIAAQWCLNGKAIIVLYADGQWGILESEIARFKAEKLSEASQEISTMVSTKFSLCGYIRPSVLSNNTVKVAANKGLNRVGLVPMTPGTRKAKQETLFAGSVDRSRFRGRGSVLVYPRFDVLNEKAMDDSVLIWYEETALTITSLVLLWKNEANGSKNFLNKETGMQSTQINKAHLKGEVLKEVCLIPKLSLLHQHPTKTRQLETLVTGEHRLVILSSPSVELDVQPPKNLPFRSLSDQTMLAARELDVNGIDRMLTNMSDRIHV